MKKRWFPLFLILGLCAVGHAQEKKWNAEAVYPLNLGKGYDQYHGIIGLGLSYQFLETEKFRFHGGIRGSFFTDRPGPNNSDDYQLNLFLVQPYAGMELKLGELSKWHPYIRLGYSFVRNANKGTISGMDVSVWESHASGPYAALGIRYDLSRRMYLLGEMQHNWLREDQYGLRFSEGLPVFSVGVGFRF